MTQLVAFIEGLPEVGTLLFLGASLILAGIVLRKATYAYQPVRFHQRNPGA
jgi:hypothetical protein